jgi:D-amino peptidase
VAIDMKGGNGMKVLMMTDLEGVAGVVSFADHAEPSGRYYEASRKLLTAEVNAAVEGLLEVGVEEVLVIDGHGPGGISFEDLHEAAKLLHGRPLVPWSHLYPIISQYDATVMIGQHAMAGTPTGNLNHTQSHRTIDYYRLNGKPIGEIAQWALFCGALGVPLIFLSGDEAACREAEALIPTITTVAVKKGLGMYSAISLPAKEARRLIKEGIIKAVEYYKQRKERGDPIAPLVWDGPYVLEIRFFSTSDADARASQPGAERVDSHTVRFRSENILDIIYR